MFDDVLNATTLVGVSAVIAAVFVTAAVEPPPPIGRPQPVAGAPAANSIADAKVEAKAVAAMPIYELPRVVVTGHRSRDGDMMAATETPPAPLLPSPAR